MYRNIARVLNGWHIDRAGGGMRSQCETPGCSPGGSSDLAFCYKFIA